VACRTDLSSFVLPITDGGECFVRKEELPGLSGSLEWAGKRDIPEESVTTVRIFKWRIELESGAFPHIHAYN